MRTRHVYPDIEGTTVYPSDTMTAQYTTAPLTRMGFSATAAERALRATNGDLDAAVNLLLGGAYRAATEAPPPRQATRPPPSKQRSEAFANNRGHEAFTSFGRRCADVCWHRALQCAGACRRAGCCFDRACPVSPTTLPPAVLVTLWLFTLMLGFWGTIHLAVVVTAIRQIRRAGTGGAPMSRVAMLLFTSFLLFGFCTAIKLAIIMMAVAAFGRMTPDAVLADAAARARMQAATHTGQRHRFDCSSGGCGFKLDGTVQGVQHGMRGQAPAAPAPVPAPAAPGAAAAAAPAPNSRFTGPGEASASGPTDKKCF